MEKLVEFSSLSNSRYSFDSKRYTENTICAMCIFDECEFVVVVCDVNQ